MTTGTSPEPPAAWRRWALAQLDLPPGMSDDEARRILFGRLSDMDFMPPSGWDSALRVAGMAPCEGALDGPVFVPARRDMEQAMRADIESFAAQFFSLPPALRTARYQDLVKQAVGVPALASRLENLRPGLDLPCELPTGQSPEATELLEQVRRLFVLPPQERASRRMAFLKQCRSNWSDWQRAAIVVQAKIARVASLETMLFRELCTSDSREKRRQKLTRRRRRATQGIHSATTVSHRSEGNRWWIVAVAAVLLTAIRLLSGNQSHRSNPFTARTSQPWSVQEAQHHGDLEKMLSDIQKRLDEEATGGAAQGGKRSRDRADRVAAPPKASPPKAAPSSPQSPSLLSQTEGVEIHIAKSPEEAREIVRQVQDRQAKTKPPQAAPPRVEMHALNLEQARELLRQMREQQAQGGPNKARDATISALEKAIESASRSSQKQP